MQSSVRYGQMRGLPRCVPAAAVALGSRPARLATADPELLSTGLSYGKAETMSAVRAGWRLGTWPRLAYSSSSGSETVCGAADGWEEWAAGESLLLGQDGIRTREERLILVDGSSIMYRAYHKLMARIHHGKLKDGNFDGNGDSILTVFGALSMILRLLDLQPSHVAVALDNRGITFRHILLPSYKAGRPPTPDTITEASGYLKSALHAMEIPVIEAHCVEADDIIGTLAVKAVAAGMKVRIVSVDKDFFQLLSPSLRLLRFLPRGPGTVSFGVKDFKKSFGNLEPSQFVDVMALVGDRADNIPGVPGIGKKTALKLISEYGSLEILLQECKNLTGKRTRESLINHMPTAILGKTLVSLQSELPSSVVSHTLQDLVFRKPKDGGQHYMSLLDAMGRCVDHPDSEQLKQQAVMLWKFLDQTNAKAALDIEAV